MSVRNHKAVFDDDEPGAASVGRFDVSEAGLIMRSTIRGSVGVGAGVGTAVRVAVGLGVAVGIGAVAVGIGALVTVDVLLGIASTVAATPASMVAGTSGVPVGVSDGSAARTIA